MIIKRDSYLNQIIAGKENGLIKIITGIRRCGKSFLLFNLFYDYLIDSGIAKDHIIKVAFDDWNFRELCNSDKLMEYIKGRITDDDMHYILLDEATSLCPSLTGFCAKGTSIYTLPEVIHTSFPTTSQRNFAAGETKYTSILCPLPSLCRWNNGIQ